MMIDSLLANKIFLNVVSIFVLSSCAVTKELPSRVPPKTLKVQMVSTTEIDSQPAHFVFCSNDGAWGCDDATAKTNLTEKQKHQRETEFNLEKSIGKEDEFLRIVQQETRNMPTENVERFRLFFDFDSAVLTDKAIQKIEEVAALYEEEAVGEIVLNGFTDNIGTEAYNDTLALERANAVKNKLKSFGVKKGFELSGQGKCCFLSDNKSEVGRAKNRRVEIHLVERTVD